MGNQWQRCKKRAKKHEILVIWKFGKIQYIRVQSDPPKKRMKIQWYTKVMSVHTALGK